MERITRHKMFVQLLKKVFSRSIGHFTRPNTPNNTRQMPFLASFSISMVIVAFKSTNCFLCPSSIQCQDSNSQPLEHEPPPITTIPGLPPLQTCPTTDQLWVPVLFGQLWSWSFVVKWGSNQASQILLYNDCELQAFNANALDRLFKYSIYFVV